MKRVLLGMSGGVDSSVAAVILQRQGYDVTGITLRLWTEDEDTDAPGSGRQCCSINDVNDARSVAGQLGVPHYVLNFKDAFRERVVDEFIREYRQGRTPNPCIACNQQIKFDLMLARARVLGFDYVATGHYARIDQDPVGRQYRLWRGRDGHKDQSYVLYGMTQDQLARTLLPLGDWEKDKIRGLAAEIGLETAHKPDSQEICFVDQRGYRAFLQRNSAGDSPGGFLDTAGQVIGTHQGITRYTIGQRKGLGTAFGRPLFVTKINVADNTVTLGDEADLYSPGLLADHINLINLAQIIEPMQVTVKIRYQASFVPATLLPGQNRAASIGAIEASNSIGALIVRFQEPQRAVTPGQAVVFYLGDQVVGGGRIRSDLPRE